MPSWRWETQSILGCVPLHWAQIAWLAQLRVEWPKPWQLWHCLERDFVEVVDDVFGVVVAALGHLPGWGSVWLVSCDRRRRLFRLAVAVFQPSSGRSSSGGEAAGAGRRSSGAGAAGADDWSSSREVFICAFVFAFALVLVLFPRRGWGCFIAGTVLPKGSSSRLSRSSTHLWNSEVRWSRRALRSAVERRMVVVEVLLIRRSREKCETSARCR